MLKTSISVTLTLSCGDPITFDDAVSAGKGTAVYQQLGHDIRVADYNDKDYFIREGAVCMAEVTKTTTTVTVEDDTCPAGDGNGE